MPQVLMAVGLVGQLIGARKSAKAQKESLRLQKEQQAVQTRRSRRSQIREMQIRRASAMAGAEGAGTSTGSGAMGGIGSLGSQLGANMGFSTQMSGLSAGINAAEQKNISGQFISGMGQLAFNAGSTFGGQGSGGGG